MKDTSLDVEFGNPKLMERGDGLNIVRPEKNNAVRFALLQKARKALIHYVGEKGSLLCLAEQNSEEGAACCQRYGDPQLRVVALCIHYVNADADGRLPKGTVPEIEIGYVRLSQPNYRSISMLPPDERTVYDLDIVMSHRASGIGYDFIVASSTPRYRAAGLEKEVERLATPFLDGKKLASKLGKKMTEAEFKAVLDGDAMDVEED